MNCTQARALCPLAHYGELSLEEKQALERHVEACAACKAELQAFGQTARLLETAREPAASVEVAAVYREAARLAERDRRRWRRWAWALGSAAAALLLVLCLRVEVRWDQGELVVGWRLSSRPPAPREVIREVAVLPPEVAHDLQVLRDLVHGVAAVAVQPAPAPADHAMERGAVAELSKRLERFLADTDRRLAAAENSLRALYFAQFGSRDKGE